MLKKESDDDDIQVISKQQWDKESAEKKKLQKELQRIERNAVIAKVMKDIIPVTDQETMNRQRADSVSEDKITHYDTGYSLQDKMWWCNCLDYAWRGGPAKRCKHLLYLQVVHHRFRSRKKIEL